MSISDSYGAEVQPHTPCVGGRVGKKGEGQGEDKGNEKWKRRDIKALYDSEESDMEDDRREGGLLKDMEKDKHSAHVVPMDEDEASNSGAAGATIICVEEDAGKDSGAGGTVQNPSVNVDVRYYVEDAEPLDEDMKNCCLLNDGEEDGGVELIEIQSDYSLDDDDMEIQRLTQSLQELGTGRMQRSLRTDRYEVQPNVSFED